MEAPPPKPLKPEPSRAARQGLVQSTWGGLPAWQVCGRSCACQCVSKTDRHERATQLLCGLRQGNAVAPLMWLHHGYAPLISMTTPSCSLVLLP